MAKKSASTLAEGSRVRAKAGVSAPECPEVLIEGWTGTVVEASGKKGTTQYVVEWDDATLGNMPGPYVTKCEANGLYYKMACLAGDDIEPLVV